MWNTGRVLRAPACTVLRAPACTVRKGTCLHHAEAAGDENNALYDKTLSRSSGAGLLFNPDRTASHVGCFCRMLSCGAPRMLSF